MGSDMMLRVQTKQDSGWVDIDLPGPLWVVLTNRNYAVFGALAGGRNSYGLPLIREVRGWPDGEVTPDGWAATWYDLQELEAHDWLGGYADRDGVDGVVRGISSRLSRNADKLVDCLPILRTHEREIDAAFERFFPELIAAAEGMRPVNDG